MSSYRPIDSKREEFRKYLEKAGAMDALTKVLIMLYDEPEKPPDALEYIRKHLGDTRSNEKEVEILKSDLETTTAKVESLENEIKVLKEKLQKYEPLEDRDPMEDETIPASVIEDAEHPVSTPAAVSADQAEGPVE